jgi:hypothetical protein
MSYVEKDLGKQGDGAVYWIGIGVVVTLSAYLVIGFLVK